MTTQPTTAEKNRVIAEWMGWNYSKTGQTARIGKGKKSSAYRLKDIQFDTSWDWLMPVVIKIESMGYDVAIYGNYCSIFELQNGERGRQLKEWHSDSKLSATYETVYQFIEQFNERGK